MAIAQEAPEVGLGETAPGGIAAAIYAIVERGVWLRPRLAEQLRGVIVLHFGEDYPPVTIVLDARIVVRDGAPSRADVSVSASMAELTALLTRGAVGGAMAVLRGRVRVDGDRALGRRLLRLMAI